MTYHMSFYRLLLAPMEGTSSLTLVLGGRAKRLQTFDIIWSSLIFCLFLCWKGAILCLDGQWVHHGEEICTLKIKENSMELTVKRFEDLSLSELYEILRVPHCRICGGTRMSLPGM